MMLRNYRGSPTRTNCRTTEEERLADGQGGKRKRAGKRLRCCTRINQAPNEAKDRLRVTTPQSYSRAHIHRHVQMAQDFPR